MELRAPFIISARLMPAVRVGTATVSIEETHRDSDGRTVYRWFVDMQDGQEFTGHDLRSGCGGGGIRDGMLSILGFLYACGESVNYARRSGRTGENADLFPPALAEWASNHTDELGMVELDITETLDCCNEQSTEAAEAFNEYNDAD